MAKVLRHPSFLCQLQGCRCICLSTPESLQTLQAGGMPSHQEGLIQHLVLQASLPRLQRVGDCKITWIVFRVALVCLILQTSEYISTLSCAAVSNTCSTKAASTVWSILLLLKLRVTSGMATKRVTTSMSPAESQLKSTLAYLHPARLHYYWICGYLHADSINGASL